MKQEDFAYIIETEKSFDEAAVSVLKAVEQKGWALFQIYDVKERLAAKGFKQKPLKIIEICSGKYANQFLNKNRLISLCMPCKINVAEESGKVKIIGMPDKFGESGKPKELWGKYGLSARSIVREINLLLK